MFLNIWHIFLHNLVLYLVLYLEAGIKIAWRNICNLRYADDIILMAENEELKSLHESERGEWKSWLKTQHSEN